MLLNLLDGPKFDFKQLNVTCFGFGMIGLTNKEEGRVCSDRFNYWTLAFIHKIQMVKRVNWCLL